MRRVGELTASGEVLYCRRFAYPSVPELASTLRILMVAAEAAPFVKVGGLADVIGGLSASLARHGHEVTISLPYYGMLRETLGLRATGVGAACRDPLFDKLSVQVRLHRVCLETVTLHLVEVSRWFDGSVNSETVYVADPAAYVVFGKVCSLLALGRCDETMPDVVHTHDWHAGLVPVYVHMAAEHGRPALVHTVHNMAYTGTVGSDVVELAGLPSTWFTWDKLEFYGGFSFLKAGMIYSDMCNTVSETYARECRSAEYGGGLAGVVEYLGEQRRFLGIINGLDTTAFDPSTDPSLPANYSVSDLAGRARCRQTLEGDLGLGHEPRSPIIGMVSRICEQKGHDLVAAAAPDLVASGARLAILGVGDPVMSAALRRVERAFPGRVAVRIGFDAYLANRIYAGCDMFLMPSRFEPCGLGQLIALRYGAVPVVRRTGGLADTVRDADEHPRTGNGFVFEEASVAGILEGVARAMAAFRDRARWQRLVLRGMWEDHSWDRVVPRYETLYQRALARGQSGVSG